MSEADYMSSVDNYFANKDAIERERMVRTKKTTKQVDVNGHALCGCGMLAKKDGKLTPWDPIRYRIMCYGCGTSTRWFWNEDEAWATWDTAMGLKVHVG